MVDLEFDSIWRQMDQAAKSGQLEPEDAEKSADELKTEYRSIAERRVRLGLLLSDVGQKNGVEVSSEDLSGSVREEALRYPGQETAVVEHYKNNQQAVEALRAPLFEEKVVDFVISVAKITDEVVGVDELLKDPDEPDTVEKPKVARKNGKAKRNRK